jgi:hypothetical protein
MSVSDEERRDAKKTGVLVSKKLMAIIQIGLFNDGPVPE